MGDLWRWDGWPTAAEWQALGAVTTAVVAAGAAWIAVHQLRAHHAMQREQSRPYVIVDFAFHASLLMISVTNLGQTPARDIRFKWSPEPVGLDEDATGKIQERLVRGSIPFLAPGRSIRFEVGSDAKYWDSPDTPNLLDVEAIYLDMDGRSYGLGERMMLDLGQWAGTLAESDADRNVASQVKRLADSQKKIVDHIKRIDATSAALLPTLAELGVHSVAAVNRSQVSGVVWAVLRSSEHGRLVANVGSRCAESVTLADVTNDAGRSGLRLDGDEEPREIEPGEAITATMMRSLADPDVSAVRIRWTEEGEQREAVYAIG